MSLDIRPWRASAPLSLQPLRELGRGRLLGRDGLPLPAPLPWLLLPAHHSTLRDVMSREKFRRTAPLLDPPRIEGQGRIEELALGRIALVTVAVVLALAPLTVRCPPASGRDLRTAPTLGTCALALALGETGLDPRIDTGLAGTALDVTGRGLLTATDHSDSVRVPPARREARGHAIFLPPLTVRGPSKGRGRRARREQQEGVETLTVSQAPAVSEAPAIATPAAVGATLAALPSAVQDLARFFLSLSGSSSLGAAGGVAGVAAPASGVGVQLCPWLLEMVQSHLVLRLRFLLGG